MLKPLVKTKTIDYSTNLLPAAWFQRNSTHQLDFLNTGGLYANMSDGSFRKKLLQTIRDAREVVVLASFLIADKELIDALRTAAERKVRIYVLTASDTHLSKITKEDDLFEIQMVREHKEFLDAVAGSIALRSASHFHAKFIVADPGSENPTGLLSTANFNKALTTSVELGVELSVEQSKTLANWYCYSHFIEAERELVRQKELVEVRPLAAEVRTPTPTDIKVTTKRHQTLRDSVRDMIGRAQKKLLVSSYGLSLDHEVTKLLCQRSREGVAITLFTRPRPKVTSAVKALLQAGVKILGHDKLHAKAILSESEGMVFTANLEEHGLDTGFEVGVLLQGDQLRILRSTLESWEQGFPWQACLEKQRRHHRGALRLMDSAAKDGVCCVSHEDYKIVLPTVTASCSLQLQQTPEPPFVEPNINTFYKTITYEYTIEPPKLPPKAKELKQTVKARTTNKEGKESLVSTEVPYEPPVYQYQGQTYVVWLDHYSREQVVKQSEDHKAIVVIR